MRKPERRIFEHTCALLGVAPEATLLLDDMHANIDGATDAGLTAMLVADPEVAISSVRQLIWG